MKTRLQIMMVAALTLACLVGGLPRSASAQEPRDKARALFLEANGLFDRGMYQDALTLYRKARALYPSFKIDLNIGGTLDALGRKTEAAVYFERFLLNSSKASRPVIREARRRLKVLRRQLGWLKVTTMAEGALIAVDGKSVGHTPHDLPIYLIPGSHRISVKKQGFAPRVKMITIGAGKRQTLDFLLDPIESAGARPTTSAVRVEADPATARRRRSKAIWGFTSLGVGVALTAGAAVLYGVGLSSGTDSYRSYMEATTVAEADARYGDVESARTLVTVGHVLMGAAVVAYGLSIYSFVTRPCAPEQATQAPQTTVTVAPAGNGAVLSIGGSF